ncbi:flagellar hook-associated protein FlgK [Jutongia sp.]
MGSLFTSFNTGVSGLHTAQSGLNTTSHNLANVKTKGYTRQQNIQTDRYYQNVKVAVDGSQIQTGLGTTVSAIRQIRDAFLDKEYHLETGRQAFYEKLSETSGEIEDIFGETEGMEFRNNLQSLWNVMQEMANNPEDITKRRLFVSTAESFLETAQNIYTQLNTYQVSLNKEISEQVDRINTIGETIAYYNKEIVKIEAGGVENANDYRDARNLLLDELATYTNFNYQEDEKGSIQVYIENALFVDAGVSYHLGCEKIPENGFYTVRWLDNGYGDAFDTSEAYSTERKTDVGSLRGILTARGLKIASYADIPDEPQKEDFIDDAGVFDETAYKVAKNKYEAEVSVYNNTTGNSIITQIQAQFDRLIHNVVTKINDAFAPNIEINGDQVNLDAATTGTTADGETFDLTKLTGGKYKVLDVINCPVGADDHETIGTEVFSRGQVDRYQKITLDEQIYGKDADGNDIPLAQKIVDADGNETYTLYLYNEENENDIDWMYTLNSMVINKELTADYSLLEVKANPALGLDGAYAFGQNLFQDLLQSWDENLGVLDPNSQASYNFDDYYTNMIGGLGIRGNDWNNMVDYQTSLAESIEDRRQQVAGVSSDEELVNMMKYQHAYNAASRYINTIDSMLETLIERLG